jgi:EAL domain-containing protein (putative c-di-GMP-specific phosphodiesterase class I)
MVRAMTGIARELGVEIMAQGVETKEQRDFLMRCDATSKAQGYYFSRPLAAEQAEEMLRRGRLDAPLDPG